MIRKTAIFLMLILALLCPSKIWGQYESTGFTATGGAGMSTTHLHDYQAVGINPAAIGTGEKYNIAFGFLEGGFSIHSQALSRSNLSDLLISNDSVVITSNLKRDFSKSFVGKGFAVDLNFMVGGFAFQVFKRIAGGVKVDMESNFRTQFNEFASNFYFEGHRYDAYFDRQVVDGTDTFGISSNPGQLFDLMQGSYLKGSLTIPVTSGFGFKIRETENTQVFGGIGVKYVFGITHLNFDARNGSIEGRGSYNRQIPMGIQLINGRFSTANNWKPAGGGWGFDVGAIYKYKKSLTVGAGITDIGVITWKRNLFFINNALLDSTGFGGADNLNFKEVYEELNADESIINTELDPFKVSMPTQFRAGASYALWRVFRVGLDVIVPINDAPGNYQSPYIGLGANLNAFGLFNISAGVNYVEDYGFSFPFGLVYGSKGKKQYEAGLASRDLLSIFSEDNPNISYNFGFLRFKF